MATYSIRTTRTQEIGLKFNYDTYGDKIAFPTQEAYFQHHIDHQVTDPMYAQYQQAQSISFDQSFNTIPETSQPKAQDEIEAVIIANGGTVIPAGAPPAPIPQIVRAEEKNGE